MMDALPVSWTMQTNGITVDAVALDKQIAHHTEQAKQLMEKIETSDIAKVFEKKNNQPLKYNSTADLRKLFYKQLKLRPTKLTETGVPSTDAESIEALVTSKDLQADAKDFLQTLLTYRKHEKILSTYLLPYKDYTTAEQTIHATFALHTTRTYRSSYISPNLQNIPKRSEFGAQLRTVFVPKYDWFLDGDFKGAELRVMAMYSQDPALIHAANNNIDIHTYWTARVFDISEDKVTKEQRDKAKQFFVFALFYGGWYKTAARMLDVPVARIKKLEDELWAMYPKMKAWQEQIKQHYNKYGFVENLQGFRRYGPLSIREQINTPIQGTSFLILLDCMKNLHNELTAKNFKSYICLQIHDELVVDCKESEIEEIVDIANKHFNITIYNVQIMVEWSIGKNFGELRKISV